MSSNSRITRCLVWGGLLLIIAGISGAFLWNNLSPAGKGAAHPLPVYGQVVDFTLTNQFGQAVSLATFRGHLWLADIIFTRCPGPCSKMTKLMSELQAALPAKSPVKLVSLTTDPDFDTPSILEMYGKRFKTDFQQWSFLTGDKRQIHRLAVGNLKLVLVEKEPDFRETPEDLFVHSTAITLIDTQGRVRGIYETTESQSKQRILAAVTTLLNERTR
ncbi:MAG: SCO family protein [Verrucomicrobiota bacterium]